MCIRMKRSVAIRIRIVYRVLVLNCTETVLVVVRIVLVRIVAVIGLVVAKLLLVQVEGEIEGRHRSARCPGMKRRIKLCRDHTQERTH